MGPFPPDFDFLAAIKAMNRDADQCKECARWRSMKQCTVRLRGEVRRARRVTDSRIKAGILNDLERELNRLGGTDG